MILVMKRFLIAVIVGILSTGCKTVYYTYYEADSPEDATWFSRFDGRLARDGKSPTRCIQSYMDSTGRRVFLMETRTEE